MFVRENLTIRVAALLADVNFSRYPGLHYTIYPQDAFETASSEECIRITRSPKRVGDDGLAFWLAAEFADDETARPWADGWARRQESFLTGLSRRALRGISEEEFNALVKDCCVWLLAPPTKPLHPSGGFVGALVIDEMGDDLVVTALAEYEDEFIHFSWESTA